jgi:hypothetical protein
VTDDDPARNGDSAASEEEPPWPIGFIVLVSLAALYVGWRLVQLTVRAVDWLF